MSDSNFCSPICSGSRDTTFGSFVRFMAGPARQKLQCLHCMDSKAGEKVPRPLGETVHGTRPGEVVHFDYLYVGASGLLGDDCLDEDRC